MWFNLNHRVLFTAIIYCASNSIVSSIDGSVRFPQIGCDGTLLPLYFRKQKQHTRPLELNKNLTKTPKIVTTWENFDRGHTVRIALKADYSKPLCGGIIQNALYIITAAHCLDEIEPNEILVSAGLQTFGLAQNRSVVSFIVHKNWNPKTFSNDIAILKLNDSLVLSTGGGGVCPIPIGKPNLTNASIEFSWITGWGLRKLWPNETLVYTPYVAQSPAPLVDFESCKEIYRKLGKSVTETQICAGGIVDCGPCTGDDGGPLTVHVLYDTRVNRNYVIGLLSTYDGCATGVPDIYTNLESYKTWIESTTGRQCDFNIYAADSAKALRISSLKQHQKPKGRIQISVAIAICVSYYQFLQTHNIQSPLKNELLLRNITLTFQTFSITFLEAQADARFCTHLQWNTCHMCQKFVHVKCQSASLQVKNVDSKPNIRPRIVGGQDAMPNQHPYQVRISIVHDDRLTQAACSGVIYNSQYILTTARCVHVVNGPAHLPCRLLVTAGDHSVSVKEDTEQIRRVVLIVFHEKFVNKFPFDNDIALLKIDSPLNFSIHTQNILLATKEYPNEDVKFAELSGWGEVSTYHDRADILQTVKIPLVDDCDCRLFYSSFDYNAFNSHKICAGSLNHGYCGDSDEGNPLTVIDGGIKYLAGVSSFAGLCGFEQSPSYSTKVLAFREWISIRAG